MTEMVTKLLHKIPILWLLISIAFHQVYGFTHSQYLPPSVLTSSVRSLAEHLTPRFPSSLIPFRSVPRRPYGCYATTKETEKLIEQQRNEAASGVGSDETTTNEKNEAFSSINGEVSTTKAVDHTSSTTTTPLMVGGVNATSQVTEIMDEISRRINEGATELVQNISNVVDEQMTQLPESAAVELTEYFSDLAAKIQKAQMEEIQRQMEELEKIFVSPLERVAFSDAPLFELDQKMVQQLPVDTEFLEENRDERKLILAGANSTLTKTARMRTGEIIRNFNVAPMYYSVALLYRWFRKASVRCVGNAMVGYN